MATELSSLSSLQKQNKTITLVHNLMPKIEKGKKKDKKNFHMYDSSKERKEEWLTI